MGDADRTEHCERHGGAQRNTGRLIWASMNTQGISKDKHQTYQKKQNTSKTSKPRTPNINKSTKAQEIKKNRNTERTQDEHYNKSSQVKSGKKKPATTTTIMLSVFHKTKGENQ